MTLEPRATAERAILVTVGLAGMLVPLNSTMIAVALPQITSDLGATVAESGWLATAYLITMASLLPIAGKLGDRFGRRPFLLGGLVTFAASSVAAALAGDVLWLIAFRAGQAVSGAVLFPNGMALLREVVPAQRRGARFGVLGSAIAFGAAVGPPLGGALVHAGGWPAIFWVNVPFTAAVFGIGWFTIPPARPRPSESRFDLRGAALLAAVLALGAWLLTRLGEVAAGPAVAAGAGVVCGFVAFVWLELRHADPVVQPRFFARRPFAAATGGIALSNLSMYALLLAVPLLLAPRPGWTPGRIGLAITSMSAGMVLLAPIGGRLSDRLGRRAPAFGGMALLAFGASMLALLGTEVGTGVLIGALAVVGAGLGLGSGSLQTSAVESIEPEHAGMAAAASSTSRYIGSIVGAAVLAGLVTAQNGFQAVFMMTAAAAILALLLSLGLPSRIPQEQPTLQEEAITRP